jgi:hypothetical protein
MIHNIFRGFGIGGGSPSPYKLPEINFVYNSLFCEDLSQFRPNGAEAPAHWQAALFNSEPDASAIRRIAESNDEESRVRILAYNWLRQHKHAVPSRELLAVIVEVPLAGGLDVLAAYSDGRVRYINQTGKLAVFEGAPYQIEQKARSLVASAVPAVNRIGPWEKKRLPPPKQGNVRITFLVSGGLCFGEGPFSLMQREPTAAPIIQNSSELLQLVVNEAGDKTK